MLVVWEAERASNRTNSRMGDRDGGAVPGMWGKKREGRGRGCEEEDVRFERLPVYANEADSVRSSLVVTDHTSVGSLPIGPEIL